MDSPALVAALAACGGAVIVLLPVVLRLSRERGSRADLEARLASAREEVAALRHRVDELTASSTAPSAGEPRMEERADFVITHVGEAGNPREDVVGVAVADRLVLSATLGEPLVKAAAFGHGVRRALSAESRNRIWFEMRREVRASRRRRRQLRRRLEREYRARLRGAEDGTPDAMFVESTA